MNSFIVEEPHEFSKQFSEFFFGSVIPEKNPFIFQSTPGSLYKDVVLASSDSVHADFNIVGFQKPDELSAGILGTAVRVEYCRNPVFLKGFPHAFQAEICPHAVREPPAQNLPAVQINHGRKIHHAPWSLDVSYICRHYLIRERDELVPQEVRELSVWRFSASCGLEDRLLAFDSKFLVQVADKLFSSPVVPESFQML